VSEASRPLIGITIGPREVGSPYLQQRVTYPLAVEALGGLPVFVPPLGVDTLGSILERLDGIMFPGGADVDPSFYEEAREPLTDVVPELDTLELEVARWSLQSDIPILGICRGQQLLNVAAGGSLVQHLDQHRQADARSTLTRPVNIEPGSRTADLLGATRVGVNHMHHQAVKRVGVGLRAIAWADDGTIEALESSGERWLFAVQFHPEELVDFHEPSRRLFAAFVQACQVRISVPALPLG
jgi:putative glutamine amidotransferase